MTEPTEGRKSINAGACLVSNTAVAPLTQVGV